MENGEITRISASDNVGIAAAVYRDTIAYVATAATQIGGIEQGIASCAHLGDESIGAAAIGGLVGAANKGKRRNGARGGSYVARDGGIAAGGSYDGATVL